MKLAEEAGMGYLFWRWMTQYCNTAPVKQCAVCDGRVCKCILDNVTREASLYPCKFEESCSFGSCMMGYGSGHPNGPCAYPIDDDDDDEFWKSVRGGVDPMSIGHGGKAIKGRL